MDCKAFLLLCICGFTFLLVVASIGGNNWMDHHDDYDIKYLYDYSGLWRTCKGHLFFNVCRDLPFEDVASWLHATRAFAVIAAIASGVGALISLVRLWKDMDGKTVSIIFLGAAISMVIALSIYTSKRITRINNCLLYTSPSPRDS